MKSTQVGLILMFCIALIAGCGSSGVDEDINDGDIVETDNTDNDILDGDEESFPEVGDLGQSCHPAGDCTEPYVCDSNSICIIDEDLNIGGMGQPCSDENICDDILVCLPDGTCGDDPNPETGGLGQSCNTDKRCDDNLTCLEDGLCNTDPDTNRGDKNQQCTDAGGCDNGYDCLINGVCGVAPLTCEALEEQCSSNEDCPEEWVCKNEICIAPVSGDDYDFAENISFLSKIQIPEAGDDCCFDVNGDGKPDNALGGLINILLTTTDGGQEDLDKPISDYLQESIDSDVNSILFEFKNLPTDGCGPTQLWIHRGEGDTNFDGVTDQSAEDRNEGNGVFQVNPDSFSSGHGPEAQFNRAYFENGVMKAEGGSLPLTLSLLEGTKFSVMVRDVTMELPVEVVDESVVTVNGVKKRRTTYKTVDKTKENGEVECGGSMSGWVPFSDVLDDIEREARLCPCAGIDPDNPVTSYTMENGQMKSECIQDTENAPENCDSELDGAICRNLLYTCMALSVAPMMADVSSGENTDEDGNAVPDAMSLSIRMCVSGATLVEDDPIAPELQAADDSFRVDLNSAPARLGVLANDIDAENDTPTITSVNTENTLGTVEIVQDGASIRYTPKTDSDEGDSFKYTIGSGDRTSTATVKLTVTYMPDAKDDYPEVVFYNRGSVELNILDNDTWDDSLVKEDISIQLNGDSPHTGEVTIDNQNKIIDYEPERYNEESSTFTDVIYYTIFDGRRKDSATVFVELALPQTDCGDGIIDYWVEECDDGEELNGTLGYCDLDCAGLVTVPDGDMEEDAELEIEDGDIDEELEQEIETEDGDLDIEAELEMELEDEVEEEIEDTDPCAALNCEQYCTMHGGEGSTYVCAPIDDELKCICTFPVCDSRFELMCFDKTYNSCTCSTMGPCIQWDFDQICDKDICQEYFPDDYVYDNEDCQ